MVYKNTPEADPNEAYKLRGAVNGNRKLTPGKINPGNAPLKTPPKRGIPEGAGGKRPYNPTDTVKRAPENERMRVVQPKGDRTTPGTIKRPTPTPSPVASKPLPNPPGPNSPTTRPGGIGRRGTKPTGNFTKRPEFNKQQTEEEDPNKKAALRRLQMRRNRRG